MALAFLMVRSSWVGYGFALAVLCAGLFIIDKSRLFLWLRHHTLILFAFLLLFAATSTISPIYRKLDHAVLVELQSFTLGSKSENVKTRFYLWQDAISEVFSIGLFSGHVKKDVSRCYLSVYRMKSDQTSIQIPIVERGRTVQAIEVHLDASSSEASLQKSSAAPSVYSSHAIQILMPISPLMGVASAAPPTTAALRFRRILLGLPFGKPFYPPQVSGWLSETSRYDPHNSFIAILYRMGILGLGFYFIILFSLIRYLCQCIQNESLPTSVRIAAASLLAGIVYHQVHSLTDVTMENPFKGVFLWILIGLARHPTFLSNSFEDPNRS